MKYTGWCQNDFSVQGSPRPERPARSSPSWSLAPAAPLYTAREASLRAARQEACLAIEMIELCHAN
jgi:hypothetical protein